MNTRFVEALIREIASRIPCAACGRRYAQSDITVLGQVESLWALKLTCRQCRSLGLVFAVVHEDGTRPILTDLTPEEWEMVQQRPALSADDVIQMYRAMETYTGDFSEILEDPLPADALTEP
jgi:hypothetical protein